MLNLHVRKLWNTKDFVSTSLELIAVGTPSDQKSPLHFWFLFSWNGFNGQLTLIIAWSSAKVIWFKSHRFYLLWISKTQDPEAFSLRWEWRPHKKCLLSGTWSGQWIIWFISIHKLIDFTHVLYKHFQTTIKIESHFSYKAHYRSRWSHLFK